MAQTLNGETKYYLSKLVSSLWEVMMRDVLSSIYWDSALCGGGGFTSKLRNGLE